MMTELECMSVLWTEQWHVALLELQVKPLIPLAYSGMTQIDCQTPAMHFTSSVQAVADFTCIVLYMQCCGSPGSHW